MDRTVLILVLWVIELLIIAFVENRASLENKLINVSVLLTSLLFTFKWGGIWWVIVPLLVIPVFAGLVGGIVIGLISKHKKTNS
jgi:hypothetical protein